MRLFHALCFALLTSPVAAARAEVTVRLQFTYLADGTTTAAPPEPQVQVTDLLAQSAVAVQGDGAAAAGTRGVVVTVPDTAFTGPYARLRLAVAGLRLPAGDSKSDQDIRFAFELVLRRDQVGDVVDLRVPVVTSSRRGALKPYMGMPQIAEELPERFFLAQQWMSLYEASPEAVDASPKSFALHRLISRAIADFSVAMADIAPGAALVVPSEELGRVLELYWDRSPKGRAQHLRAYADARTILWMDLARTEEILRTARRAGVETPLHCNRARELIAFFEANRPAEVEAEKVDSLFPNPGTLDGYIEGRKLDVKFTCSRFRI